MIENIKNIISVASFFLVLALILDTKNTILWFADIWHTIQTAF